MQCKIAQTYQVTIDEEHEPLDLDIGEVVAGRKLQYPGCGDDGLHEAVSHDAGPEGREGHGEGKGQSWSIESSQGRGETDDALLLDILPDVLDKGLCGPEDQARLELYQRGSECRDCEAHTVGHGGEEQSLHCRPKDIDNGLRGDLVQPKDEEEFNREERDEEDDEFGILLVEDPPPAFEDDGGGRRGGRFGRGYE